MRLSCLRQVRRIYAELDYARHMPKEYVEKLKRTVPRIVFDGRYGAPPIVRWMLHPEDYVPEAKRPWEDSEFSRNLKLVDSYHSGWLLSKSWRKQFNRRKELNPIPVEKWTIFPGDFVQVMIGKDKGKQGTVSHVIKEANSVFVDGLHTKLNEEALGKSRYGISSPLMWKEQPLDVSERQVMLVDPSDNEPCEAEWLLNEEKDGYVRVSLRSGFEIPLPKRAFVTYDYVTPETYIEVPDKDTPAKLALEKTYEAKLKCFEDEIMEEMGIDEKRKRKPTYWY